MICPKCHTLNDDEEKFCRKCGFQLNSSRICPTCGKTNDSNSKYCKECGTVLTPVNTFRKQVIEENTKSSFFSMYKIPIICGLLIILAVGAVAGMAFYSGNSGGDDGISSFIPTGNGTGFFGEDISDDPTQARMESNGTNRTQEENITNDTNSSATLSEEVNSTNQTDNSKINETVNNSSKSKDNSSKSITEKVNSAKNSSDSSKTITEKVNSAKNSSDSSKTITEKVNSAKNSSDSSKSITEKVDTADQNKKQNNDEASSTKNSSNDAINGKDETGDNGADDSLNGEANDDNGTDDSLNDESDEDNGSNDDSKDDVNDESNEDSANDESDDVLNSSEDSAEDDSSSNMIEMADVPNLAQKVSGTGYSFSTIQYDGKDFTKAQCIYIFSEYILNANNGQSSSIEISDFSEASSPSGDDSSQSIEKSDYISIASRVHSWMNSQGSVPNYVGISQEGESDLSPNKMLELFTSATLKYGATGKLPESVEI